MSFFFLAHPVYAKFSHINQVLPCPQVNKSRHGLTTLIIGTNVAV